MCIRSVAFFCPRCGYKVVNSVKTCQCRRREQRRMERTCFLWRWLVPEHQVCTTTDDNSHAPRGFCQECRQREKTERQELERRRAQNARVARMRAEAQQAQQKHDQRRQSSYNMYSETNNSRRDRYSLPRPGVDGYGYGFPPAANCQQLNNGGMGHHGFVDPYASDKPSGGRPQHNSAQTTTTAPTRYNSTVTRQESFELYSQAAQLMPTHDFDIYIRNPRAGTAYPAATVKRPMLSVWRGADRLRPVATKPPTKLVKAHRISVSPLFSRRRDSRLPLAGVAAPIGSVSPLSFVHECDAGSVSDVNDDEH
ncbi:hypothetical protein B0H66DRAFT_527597 [Apodospora peruviana]|uniref:Uncharacterized protein n=1 Tax=Apodospora peruviana TaxID=516989 RepID=A0AAE0IS93_9PEZI|nr:hypothetical protein B0H66DRAFT_527597 [Apodospora peruviana]